MADKQPYVPVPPSRDDCVKGGLKQGNENKLNGHWQRIAPLGLHVRHHVKKGIRKPGCEFCESAIEAG